MMLSRSIVFYALHALASVMCLRSQAQQTWRRTYGGYGTETASSVQQVADGGYIVSGTCGSFGNGASDIYVLRLDPDGVPLWSKTYGTNGVEQGVGCRELNDGYIIAGSSSLGENGGYDMLLIRTDLNGTVLWQREFGTAEWDLCNALETFDDGFLLGGVTYGNGAFAGQAYFVRTDLNGQVLWTQQVEEPLGSSCRALSSSANGAFVAVGHVGTPGGMDDGYIAKYDMDGAPDWSLVVGGDSTEQLDGVVLTEDGYVVANGVTASENTFTQIYLVGVQLDGSLEWERFIGSMSDAWGTGVIEAHGSGFAITGCNTLNLGEPDMIFTRTDDDGNFQVGNNFGDGRPAWGQALSRTSDGGYVLAGWSEDYGPGLRSIYVVKTNGDGQTQSLTVTPYFDPVAVPEHHIMPNNALLSSIIHPNEPLRFNKALVSDAQLTVVDGGGRIVDLGIVQRGSSFIALPALANGLYSLSIVQDAARSIQRFVVMQ